MGHIPEQVIDEIKSRSDIVDVIGGYVQLKKAGGAYKACCPFHQEKTPSFTVSPERQAFHCFGCGAGGNVISFVMLREGVDFPNAMHILASRCGVLIPETNDDRSPDGQKTNQRERLFALHKGLAERFASILRSPAGAAAAEYLARRGVSDESILNFGLGYSLDSWDDTLRWTAAKGFSQEEALLAGVAVASDGGRVYDRFRGRIMFPIWNEQGHVVAFSARSMEPNPQGGKYVNSPETQVFTKGKTLYALCKAREGIRERGHVILCEGQLDVVAMHRAGFTNAVAPQGTAFTPEQAAMLKRYTDKVRLCFDGDSAGVKAVRRALEILLPLGFDVRVISIPGGGDPDSVYAASGAEGLAAVVDAAADFLSFELEKLGFRDASPWEKTKLVDGLLETLAKIENKIGRESYAAQLALLTGLSQASVFSELNKQLRREKFKSGPSMTESQAAERPIAPAPPPPPANQAALKAEETLLELALLHGTVARRLDAELPHELLSRGAVGKALNEAISMTMLGEWENIPAKLNAMLNEAPDPELSRVLARPTQFHKDFDLDKAVGDCVKSIKAIRIKERIAELTAQLPQVTDQEEKAALFEEIRVLQRERAKFPAAPPQM